MGAIQYILFCLVLFVSSAGYGQGFEFEHINHPKELVNENINVICKDSYGFMWFGTYNGLVRYDGYSVKRYLEYPDSGINEKIDVRCLLETKDSTLLIGTFSSGLFVFDHKTETFERHLHDDDNVSSVSSNYVISLIQDKAGSIWLGTQNGLDEFEISTGNFRHFTPFTGRGGFVCSMDEDKEGNLWLYGGSRIAIFNPTRTSFRHMALSDNPKLDDLFIFLGNILIDKSGDLWVANIIEGISRYNVKTGEVKRFNTANGSIESDHVSLVAEDSEGNVWLGSDGTGIYRYDRTLGRLILYEQDLDNPSSLFANNVHAIYESDPGVIWIGMYAGGVDILSRNKRKFQHISSKSPGKSLNIRSVLSIAELPDKRLAIGTDGGGLNIFDPVTCQFDYLTEENGRAGGNVIKSLKVDSDGHLWAGTYHKGLLSFDPKLHQSGFYRAGIHKTDNSILRDNVWALAESFDGKIWIGLLSGGVNVLDKINGSIVNYPFDSIKSEGKPCNVISLFEDSRKRMWIGTEKSGLIYYEPTCGKFNYLKFHPDNNNGLPSNEIRDIIEDSDKNIWIATGGGGLCKITSEFTFTTYKVKDGLPSNYITAILEDDNGNLWLSSDRGISRYEPANNIFTNFDVRDGLQEMGFNTRAKAKTSTGHIYFGGINGFNFFHPDSLLLNKSIPPVVITDFRIFNTPLQPGVAFKDNIYLRSSIQESKAVIIEHEDNIITIEFSALNYIAPTENQYAYRLDGFDQDWSYVGADKRFATYTNLNPGEYTFKVIGSNNDNYWNMAGTSLKIIVLPPWYLTWWFKAILTLSGIFGIVGYIYLRTRSIRQANRILEQEVRKQTAALHAVNSDLLEKNHEITQKNEMLEQSNHEISRKTARILEQQEEILKQKARLEELNRTKDKFFSIIAHDLRNPVNALMVLTKMLSREFPHPGPVGAELINNLEISSERLKSLVLNLLEWSKSQKGNIKVDPIYIALDTIVKESIELHYPQANQKEIKIVSKIESNCFVFADYNMTSTIVRNLISNSIKFSCKGGLIEIEAYPETDGRLSVSVKDNGVGMSQEQVNRVFKTDIESASTSGTEEEGGSGLGLMLVKEFIQLNGGKLNIKTEAGAGTSVSFTLPGGIDLPEPMDVSVQKNGKPIVVEDWQEREVFINSSFKGKKLLIVDDDEVIRNSLKHFLSDSFEIYEAAEVSSALSLSEKNFPDLIISDIVMPGVSGISFCQTIKTNITTSHIPVILLTGQNSEETHLDGLIAGADGYIQKPFDRRIFLSTINNLFNILERNKLRFSTSTELLPEGTAKTSHDKELLSKAVKLIEDNISDPQLKGEFLCRQLGISKTVLYMKLKNLTGQTVNEFIRSIRLKKSLPLLMQEEMSISHISDEMGFSSASYFTKSFHQYFGMSPSEFVNKQKQSKI